MIISLTKFKSEVEHYMELVGREEIVITKDGRNIAQLAPPPEDKLSILESLCGILPPTATLEEARAERLAKYEAGL
jgi:antitoxin (DNA-binding transcriptional repressor) of toxin-antitoxin stability system